VVVVFIINNIHRRNGGAASVLDLASACQEKGADVYLVLRKGSLAKFRFQFRGILNKQDRETSIPNNRIIGLPLSIPRQKRVSTSPRNIRAFIGYWLEVIVSCIFDRHRSIREVIERASLVIAAAKLNAEGWQKLRDITNAKIVLNHAGSPDTFVRFWKVKDLVSNDPKWIGCSDYVLRMVNFDALLFQSYAHEKRARELGLPSEVKGIVIEPSCNEGTVRSAKLSSSPFCNSGARNLVVVGSLQSRKNQVLGLDILQEVESTGNASTHLHFVGPTKEREYEDYLRTEVETRIIADKVTFWGFRSDYLRFVEHCNFMLVLSKGEGIPRVMREAALLGKVMIGLQSPGFDVFCPNHYSDCFFSEPNASEIAAAIKKIDQDIELREAISSEIEAAYWKHFSRDNYVKAVKERLLNYTE
jgi:glycosyltransferase involved in cell wall biosynthesis